VNKIVYLTPHFAVTGALQPEDFPGVAAQGFKSILSNLPDGESSKYPSSSEEAGLAGGAGLAFRHVPATKSDVFSDRVVEGVGRAVTELKGPVLAHCASGLR
jgi:sulfide:quinone oxidoreductase